MSQSQLFYESFNDAVRDAIRACGGTKVVATRLWPEKAPDAAARLLSDCLNDGRAERLSPDQVLLIARLAKERGCHAIVHYQCQELGYTVPSPVEPHDEAAELQRQYIEATRALLRMSERIERLRSVA